MIRRALIMLAAVAVALPGCSDSSQIQRVDGCLLSFYTYPSRLRAGEVRVSIRIQDRDYRILSGYRGTVQATGLPSHSSQTVPLKAGPGRDLRAWLTLPQSEGYAFDFLLASPEGRTLSARFEDGLPPVPESVRKTPPAGVE